MIPEAKLVYLRDKGVNIPDPYSVEIGDEVQLDRISCKGTTIYGGCRIYGSRTFISDHCIIGKEGPVTIEDCYLAPEVKIQGGYVKSSVFLNKVVVGYGAHIREGSILEEESSVAHTVGLKQTILFPFVTLGSLINFCDCFMAGGTSRQDHSEVGSSYIHFNYTPNQDKATASLLGDVPAGVMINSKPIFLGGQGGMVGPCRINYGNVIAAGTIQRKDELDQGRLIFGGAPRPGNIKHTPGVFQNIPRVTGHNLLYIANLVALMNWYSHVRIRFVPDSFPAEIVDGLKKTLLLNIRERLKRLKEFLEKASRAGNSAFGGANPTEKWDQIESLCLFFMDSSPASTEHIRRSFLNRIDDVLKQSDSKEYISIIKNLEPETSVVGTAWLSALTSDFYTQSAQLISGIKLN